MTHKGKEKFKLMADFLIACRLKAGFTQAEVAQKLGYTTPQFVSNWERALATPPLNTMAKIIRLYKIKPEAIVEVILEQQRAYILEKMKVSPKRASIKYKLEKLKRAKDLDITF